MCALAACLPARAGGVERIVERFLARADEPLSAYRGERRLEARNQRFGVEGWLEAEVSLSSNGAFAYTVLREGGSSYIRNKVLRKALQGEQDLVAQGRTRQASLTPENYAFGETPAESSDDVGRVSLRPLRKDILLVDGVMTLDPEGDLLSVEGQLSKSPSFWTTKVHVVRRYGRVAGVRVPISLESSASVRIAGTSRMTIAYRYSEINGVPVADGKDEVVDMLPLPAGDAVDNAGG